VADFYSRLLELRRAEAASRGLSKIPSDFYPQARAYLAEIRRTYEHELRENPSGRKGDVARQTHGRALQIARDVIEARATKILSAAFQTAVGGSRELANAVGEERALFDHLVEELRSFRRSAAPYLDPASAPAPGSAGATAASPPAPAMPEAASHPGPGSTNPAPPATVFVRVLKGSPPVELGGETLELRAEDVLTLPPDLARILIDGKVAEAVAAREPEP
jgi:DNA replication initiation complex subunit (GINS family)